MPRLNYTGRQRIVRSRVRLRLNENGGSPVLDVEKLDLDELSLPGDARIVVEAYRRTAYLRIEAGTVAEPDLPHRRPLGEFEAADTPLFRIKVVGVDRDRGRLLAVADRLKATKEDADEDAEDSLLPVIPWDLGHQVWKLDCSQDDPELLVNTALGDWKGFVLSPAFEALVLPEVLRQVVAWVLDGIQGLEEETHTPRHQWLQFLRTMGRDPVAEEALDDANRVTWIDDVVEHFCSRHRLLEHVIDAGETTL